MAYYFDSFVLDARTGTLRGPDGEIPLRRQAFRLCEVLLENAPELLDRDQLLDEVWGRTAVSPNVLPQAISELRQALGDNPQSPRYIETKHRRGYRFICTVERSEPEAVMRAPPTIALPCGQPTAQKGYAARQELKRQRLIAAGLVSVVLCTAMAVWLYQHWQEREALFLETIPSIRAAAGSDVFAAWRETRAALARYPDELELQQLMLDFTIPVSLASQPPAASVSVGPYKGTDTDWVALGTTPLDDIRLPLTMLRFRVSKPGFRSLDVAPSVLPVAEAFHLHPNGVPPEGMVYVPPGRVSYLGETRELQGFWIQQQEVTNREYREFVESGGYQKAEYWQERITVDGSELTMDDKTALFVDSTGLPGPSLWSLGTYPEGHGDHPVEGLSWYEAAAYARFRNMQLPTVFHWWRASGRGGEQMMNFADIVRDSNFLGTGSRPVGQGGLGPYGTHDMAGNVGEWCANASNTGRHFLGGSWRTESFAFMDPFAQPATHRGAGFGLRLMSAAVPISGEQLADVVNEAPQAITPVNDTTFEIFARQFAYDPVPLNAVLESVDRSHRAWRRERISFDAAYGDERVPLQLFIPNDAAPPYQVVVHFPGGDALLLNESADAGLLSVEPFLRTGRAVAYPVYQGTFERKARTKRGMLAARKRVIEQAQDVSRTLDYLVTREDVAQDKIAFHGLSYGGILAPFILAVENRFTSAMILSAGTVSRPLPPELTVQHYLPRVTLPTLFMGGRDDFNHSYENAQVPFFELLGTPQGQKRHVTFEGGHLPTGYAAVRRELIRWLDETLGKARRIVANSGSGG